MTNIPIDPYPKEKLIHYFSIGHVAVSTITVGGLKELLNAYPNDMPVIASWDGYPRGYIRPDRIAVEKFDNGWPADNCDFLIIDVDNY